MVSVSEIAKRVGGQVHGDGSIVVEGACTIDRPGEGKICFANELAAITADPTAKGAIMLARGGDGSDPSGTWIEVERPRQAFAVAMNTFFAPARVRAIHPSAVIDDSAHIGDDVAIGAHCVIDHSVRIGDKTVIGHNVVLGPNVTVGERCVIGSGCVIGEVGFGLVTAGEDELLRIPHVGSVVIGDEVEIGAVTTIAAGTIEPTRVRRGAKLDDHVFVAHNCDIGENVCIIACAEISGSVRIGRNSWIGPNATIRDGVSIGPDILVGMGALVTKSLEDPGTYAGIPAKLIGPKAAHRE